MNLAGISILTTERKISLKTINIEIPVADLKPVLPGFTKIIGKRTTLPVLGCVKLTLNPDKSLQIQATNLDQFVTARFNKAFKGSPCVVLVPLDELSGIVKLCSGSDTIELTGGKETIISYPAAGTIIKKSVLHLEANEFPPELQANTEPVLLDESFKLALAEALDCASTDASRYVLNGACLDVTNKEAHYVVGTDGRHLFSANSFLFDVPESIILPHGKFLTWSGFVEDGQWTLRYQPEVQGKGKAKVNAKPAIVRLDSDHWTFVTKPIEGQYPNWKQIVPGSESINSRILLGEPGIKIILDALPRLPGNEEVNQPISLEIKGDNLTLKAESKPGDGTVIPVPAKVSGLPTTIRVNRTLLAKGLKFGCREIGVCPPNQEGPTPIQLTAKGKIMVISQLRTPGAIDTKVVAPEPTSPTETTSAEVPSPAEAPKTEERTEMPAQTMAAPQRGNLTGKPETETSAIDEATAKLDAIKTGLRKVFDDLSETDRLLRKAVKEQKVSDKEINRARNALKSLQSVEI